MSSLAITNPADVDAYMGSSETTTIVTDDPQLRETGKRATTIVIKLKDADELLATTNETSAFATKAPYFTLSYAHYPVLTVLMHALNIACISLFTYYLFTDQAIIHPLILLWGIAGFGGMTIVLWKAATEIGSAAK